MVDQALKDEINHFLRTEWAINAMTEALNNRQLAIEGISCQLHERIGDEIRVDPVKQLIGELVREVLEENGYRHHAYGQKLNDPYFSTFSAYTRNTQ